MSTFTHIRRGPMGGDQYTQIHNFVFRDKRLTPNAMAVFGHVSTHADGWGTSIPRIAEGMGIGKDAVRAALAVLKRNHYVVQDQDRDDMGRVGESWYFLTDLPAQLAGLGITDLDVVEQRVAAALSDWLKENRRSVPVCTEASRLRPAETRPRRVYPKSLRKNPSSTRV